MAKSSYQLRSDAMPLPIGRGGGALSSGGGGGNVALPAPTFGAMTLGSVFFAGVAGILSQDNATFFWDTINKRLGLGTPVPALTLDVRGSVGIIQAVATSGSPYALGVTGAAHTTLAASTESSDIVIALARTVQFATGALTNERAVIISPPTYGFVGASTITNAATLAITGAPVAGTNATITNTFSLWLQAGRGRFDGGIHIKSSTAILENAGANSLADSIVFAIPSYPSTYLSKIQVSMANAGLNQMAFVICDGTSGGNVTPLTIDKGGVGFGTASPTSPAHVIGATSTTRLIGNSATPTVAITAAGAGANATTSVVGTDLSGTITLNTSVLDTPLINSDILTLTFNTTYGAAPRVIIMAANDAAWNLAYGIVRLRQADVTTSAFKMRSGGTPLTALTTATYTYNYTVIQ